jgi:acid phosphatase type 7
MSWTSPRSHRLALPALAPVFFLALGTAQGPAAPAGNASAPGNAGVPLPGPTFKVVDAELPRNPSIIVYGDMRFTDPANKDAANPEARRALVAKIGEEHPDALVLTGDIPYRGKNPDDYREYRDETAAWRAEKLRVYPVLGNHELSGRQPDDPLANWWAAFPELSHRRWYSVALGNSVYLLGLDSNSPLTAGSPQRVWLEEQIAHLPASVEFVLVALHHPPVADIQTIFEVDHNPRPNEIALREYLSNFAPHEQAKFIVAAGHIHNYERFEVDGVTYLVSGGGGAHPYPVQRTAPDQYQGTDFPIFHYILFRLDGRKLNATTYKLNFPVGTEASWHIEDQFAIAAK